MVPVIETIRLDVWCIMNQVEYIESGFVQLSYDALRQFQRLMIWLKFGKRYHRSYYLHLFLQTLGVEFSKEIHEVLLTLTCTCTMLNTWLFVYKCFHLVNFFQ